MLVKNKCLNIKQTKIINIYVGSAKCYKEDYFYFNTGSVRI